MSKSESSFKAIVDNFSRQNENNLNILKGLNQVGLSENAEYKITLTDINGEEREVSLPTFAHLKAEIERLNNNVENLSGLSDAKVSMKMPDGTFRQVQLVKLESRPEPITNLNIPQEFDQRANWFFENFVTPYLYVNFDVSGQLDSDVKKVKIKRYLLDLSDEERHEFFAENWNENSNIKYLDFLDNLRDQQISYYLDEQIVDLPLNQLPKKGTFDVTNIREEDMARNIGGVSTKALTRIYELNSMTYIDRSDSNNPVSSTLDTGDYLILNKSGKSRDTKFKVIYVDVDNNEVALDRIEGFGAITPGENKLSMYSSINQNQNIEIGINHDEQQVIFVKPIDDEFNLEAEEFSPGVGFNTNDLVINLPENLGGQMQFKEFYRNYVIDFGAHIYNMGKERIPPAIYAETPNEPNLISDNFEVKQIDRHITESTQRQQLEELNKKRLETESDISSLNVTINELTNEINSTNFIGREREEREERLSELIERKESQSSLLRSTVNEIISLSTSNPNLTTPGKYRVRGFWDLPQSTESENTPPQEVIQFLVQYRYIRPDGTGSNPDVIEYTDINGVQRQGVFSRWNEYKTDTRKRVWDDELGRYVWDDEELENADAPNINKLDIPIRFGEGVQIRIKSISEAGYPTTPITSDWSDTVSIVFPADLIERNEELQSILQESIRQDARLELIDELNSQGLSRHIQNQFTSEEGNLYRHQGSEISYISESGEVNSVQSKVAELMKEVDQLKAQLFANQSTIQLNTDDDSDDEN